eukprot:g14340.t1
MQKAGGVKSFIYKDHLKSGAKYTNVIHAIAPDFTDRSYKSRDSDTAIDRLSLMYKHIFQEMAKRSHMGGHEITGLRLMPITHKQAGKFHERLAEYTAEALDHAWYRRLSSGERGNLKDMKIRLHIHHGAKGESQANHYMEFNRAFRRLAHGCRYDRKLDYRDECRSQEEIEEEPPYIDPIPGGRELSQDLPTVLERHENTNYVQAEEGLLDSCCP